MSTDQNKLLSIKELSAELGRDRSYVTAMKSRGFRMPGGRSTLASALDWLNRNPKPRAKIVDLKLAA